MRSSWRALIGLAVLLSSCLPAAKFNTAATPLVKGFPSGSAGTPIIRLTTIPTGTPLPLDPLAPIVPHSWPAPLTYDTPPTPATPIPGPVPPIPLPPDAVNILLLGSDRRSGTGYRTDTILLLSIQPSAHGAALISIPRDLYLYLPGYSMQTRQHRLRAGGLHRISRGRPSASGRHAALQPGRHFRLLRPG